MCYAKRVTYIRIAYSVCRMWIVSDTVILCTAAVHGVRIKIYSKINCEFIERGQQQQQLVAAEQICAGTFQFHAICMIPKTDDLILWTILFLWIHNISFYMHIRCRCMCPISDIHTENLTKRCLNEFRLQISIIFFLFQFWKHARSTGLCYYYLLLLIT